MLNWLDLATREFSILINNTCISLQMRSLRCLYAHDMLATRSQQRCMVDNFRSPQPLEDRKVKASFL